MRGQRVCRSHGGGSPQAKLAARDRLAALVDPAIVTLQQALDSEDLPLAAKVARDLLDRCGYGPEREGYTVQQVEALMRGITQAFLNVVTDDDTRRRFAVELRRKVGHLELPTID